MVRLEGALLVLVVRRSATVALVAFLLVCSTVVSASPARALVPPPVPVVLPVAVGGGATVAATAPGAVVAGAGVLGFGIGYLGAKFVYMNFIREDTRDPQPSPVTGRCTRTDLGPVADAQRVATTAGYYNRKVRLYCNAPAAATAVVVHPPSGSTAYTSMCTQAMGQGSCPWIPRVSPGVFESVIAVTNPWPTTLPAGSTSSSGGYGFTQCPTGTGASCNVDLGAVTSEGPWTTADPYVGTPWTVTPRVKCKHPDGTVTVQSAASFTFTPAPGRVDVPVEVSCPVGSVPSQLEVVGGRPDDGTTTILTHELFDPSKANQYPICYPGGSLAYRCVLAPAPKSDPGQRTCFEGADCSTWPARAPQDYRCEWGPYAVPLTWCTEAYPRSWTVTDTGTGGEDEPGTGGGGGGSTEPGECFPTGWTAFNPVQWVVQPLKCVFIPSRQLSTDFAALKVKLLAAGPGPLLSAAGGLFDRLGTSAGCAGPSMHFEVRGVVRDVQLFNACSVPMSTVAALTKSLASVVLVVGGLLAIARAVSSAFGLTFSMRPSSGGDPA